MVFSSPGESDARRPRPAGAGSVPGDAGAAPEGVSWLPLDLGPTYPADPPADRAALDHAWAAALAARSVRPARIVVLVAGERQYELAVGLALQAAIACPLTALVASGTVRPGASGPLATRLRAADRVIDMGDASGGSVADRLRVLGGPAQAGVLIGGARLMLLDLRPGVKRLHDVPLDAADALRFAQALGHPRPILVAYHPPIESPFLDLLYARAVESGVVAVPIRRISDAAALVPLARMAGAHVVLHLHWVGSLLNGVVNDAEAAARRPGVRVRARRAARGSRRHRLDRPQRASSRCRRSGRPGRPAARDRRACLCRSAWCPQATEELTAAQSPIPGTGS